MQPDNPLIYPAHAPFSLQVIDQLVAVYKDAPVAVRATTFASVVSGLARCMEVGCGPKAGAGACMLTRCTVACDHPVLGLGDITAPCCVLAGAIHCVS